MEFRFALRSLLKSPSFTAISAGVLCIGLSLFLFNLAIVRGIFFAPLPHDISEKLVAMGKTVNGKLTSRSGSLSIFELEHIQKHASSFEHIAYHYSDITNISDGKKTIRHNGIYTTDSLFKTVPITPILGRVFNEEDIQGGNVNLAIISHKLWQNYFNGEKDVVGRTIAVNNTPREIIGVLPKNYQFPFNTAIWLPSTVTPSNQKSFDDYEKLFITAILKDDVSAAAAEAEVHNLVHQLNKKNSKIKHNLGAKLKPFRLFIRSDGAITISTLMIAAGLLALTLCAINVANLLWVRAAARQKEMAIRLSLGATKGHITRLFMYESLILSVIATGFSILLVGIALEATNNYIHQYSQNVPYWLQLQLTWATALYATASATITALAIAAFPALGHKGAQFSTHLKDNVGTSSNKATNQAIRWLSSAQIGLSSGLLTAALIILILMVQALDKGFGVDIDNFLATRVDPLEQTYPSSEQRINYHVRLKDAIAQIPDIKGSTLISHSPTEWPSYREIEIEGATFRPGFFPNARELTIFPDTLEVLGLPLLEGRNFLLTDTKKASRIALVSRATAERLWPNESAIGKRLRFIKKGSERKWLTVVGVVANAAWGNPFENRSAAPTVYVPLLQNTRGTMTVLLKTFDNPLNHRTALEQVISSLDPTTGTYRTTTLKLAAKSGRVFRELMTIVFVTLAIGATCVAASGIYGVVSSQVQQLTQELGIRQSYGATQNQCVLLLLRRNTPQLIIGLISGLVLGHLIGSYFVSYIGATDNLYQIAYAIGPMIVCMVTLWATLVPAFKAAKLQPIDALRGG